MEHQGPLQDKLIEDSCEGAGEASVRLIGVQEAGWEKGGSEWAEYNTFVCEDGNGDHPLGIGFFVRKRNVSAVRRVLFISDRISYIILRGCWCNIIVLNVHTTREDKSADVKDGFFEERGHVFDVS
jgi:hypothetical protein